MPEDYVSATRRMEKRLNAMIMIGMSPRFLPVDKYEKEAVKAFLKEMGKDCKWNEKTTEDLIFCGVPCVLVGDIFYLDQWLWVKTSSATV